MIEIAGRPILQANIEAIAKAGIRQIAINTHYRPDVIEAFFGDGSAFGVEIRYAREPVLLGTAGAARNVAAFLRDDDFVVAYGDNLSTIDLAREIAFHRDNDADITIALFRREDVAASGIVATEANGRITRFLEKPRPDEVFSNWVNAGYYVAKPWILDAIPADGPSDFGRDVLPELLARGARLFGYRMDEDLWWIDSMADYDRTIAAAGGR
jgi:mannose-1-phosphate guanylyltransferase/phosphomannomutase